ncbi:MAG: hypothetical protein ACFFEV_08510, partial [Candidatus Thorarchaeota archaeon]
MSSSIDIVTQRDSALSNYIDLKRKPIRSNLPSTMVKVVQGIIKRVNNHGDNALLEYTRWFDKLELNQS